MKARGTRTAEANGGWCPFGFGEYVVLEGALPGETRTKGIHREAQTERLLNY